MARRAETQLAIRGNLARTPAELPPQARPRREKVEPPDARDQQAQLRQPPAQQVAVLLQETLDLRGLAVAEGHDLVVQVDGFDRLDVDRRTASRHAVHDPLEGALRLGADWDHVPVAADGDERVLERARHFRTADDGFEGVLQPFVPAAALLAHRVELVASGVLQLAGRGDFTVQKADQVAEVGKVTSRGPQARKIGARLRQRGLEPPSGFHERDEVEHFERRQDGAFHLQAQEDRGGGGDRAERHGTPNLEVAHHFGEEPVLPLHHARVVGGAKGAGAGGARGAHRFGREQVQNAVKFQRRQDVLDHLPYQRLYFLIDRALHLG